MVEKTVAVLQRNFYWPKFRHDVDQYIRLCTTCDIAMLSVKKLGLYTPLPAQDKPWEFVSMDYISRFPFTKHCHDCAFVFVNRFSKFSILIPYKKSITVDTTALLFFMHIWFHFGIPQTIISDRDSRFLDTFWSIIWSLMDTKLTKFTSFHPQTDGQTEVVNGLIVHILCMYNSKHPLTWDESLPYVQHSYNRALHSSIGHNPFHMCLWFYPLAPNDVAMPILASLT